MPFPVAAALALKGAKKVGGKVFGHIAKNKGAYAAGAVAVGALVGATVIARRRGEVVVRDAQGRERVIKTRRSRRNRFRRNGASRREIRELREQLDRQRQETMLLLATRGGR